MNSALASYDIYHVGVSGGKDSTAALLWAVNESGWPRENIRASYCDPGNDHEFTHQYIAELSRRVHPIDIITPPLDFYKLAEKKGRFPAVKSRFCTQQLKIFPTQAHIKQFQQAGLSVLLVSGVRRAESEERSELPEFEFDDYYMADMYRPLIDWSVEDIWAYLKHWGVPRNLLYEFGARRVGCFPCIMSSKAEIRTIAKHFPERIDMIREAERRIDSTFFRRTTTPEVFRSKEIVTKKGKKLTVPTIDDVVAWSQTGYRKRGGQYEMDLGDGDTCPSNTGMCE